MQLISACKHPRLADVGRNRGMVIKDKRAKGTEGIEICIADGQYTYIAHNDYIDNVDSGVSMFRLCFIIYPAMLYK